MLLSYSLLHVVSICLGLFVLTNTETVSESFDSAGNGHGAETLTAVLRQMNYMQEKMMKLGESEMRLEQSVSALTKQVRKSEKLVEELSYQITNLKQDAKEKDDRIKVLEDMLTKAGKTNETIQEGNLKLGHGHGMDKSGSVIRNGITVKRDKGIRQTSESVFFSTYLDHVLSNLGQDQPIVYNVVLQNEAGSYSSTSGIFYTPLSGVYLFSWSTSARVLPGGQLYDVWVKLVVNGVHQLGAAAESQVAKDDNQGSNTIIIRLKKGDEVWTASQNSGSSLFGADNERTTSFTGVLLYPS